MRRQAKTAGIFFSNGITLHSSAGDREELTENCVLTPQRSDMENDDMRHHSVYLVHVCADASELED